MSYVPCLLNTILDGRDGCWRSEQCSRDHLNHKQCGVTLALLESCVLVALNTTFNPVFCLCASLETGLSRSPKTCWATIECR
jgi:hypothetical protein